MKKNLLRFTVAALSATVFVATAMAVPPKPSACPKVANIKAAGLAIATNQDSYDSSYFAAQIDRYNTANTWGFVLGPIAATFAEEALSKGGKVLQTISGNPVPQYKADYGVWYCAYTAPYGYAAVAMTPIPSGKAIATVALVSKR